MPPHTIDIASKLKQIERLWTPYVIAELNGQYVKVAKLKGQFVWHTHDDEDEMFLVIEGLLIIDFRNGESTRVEAGQCVVVPKGLEHRPRTGPEGASVMLFEPAGTRHTGNKITDKTIVETLWL